MTPDKEVFGLREYKSGNEIKTSWTRIGIGFSNKDGSINIKLDYIPTNSDIRIQVRNLKPREDLTQEVHLDDRG